MIRSSILGWIHLTVGALLVALVLRTWFVLGLIEPVMVAGSSMAPQLCGSHYVGLCPQCGQSMRVATEFAAPGDKVCCASCAELDVEFRFSEVKRGDRLLIDRTAYHWRRPRRWETVVFRRPDDGGQLCVKRVVGLPGETIEVRQGDVWIDGRVAVKSLAQQRALRQRAAYGRGFSSCWVPSEPNTWQQSGATWSYSPQAGSNRCWLRYEHPGGSPISDDLTYNAQLSRPLNGVGDLMLSLLCSTEEHGALAIEVSCCEPKLTVELDPVQETAVLYREDEQVHATRLTRALRAQLGRGPFLLEVSTFDRQLLLALEGQIVLRQPLDQLATKCPTASPFAIAPLGAKIALSDLTLWRDLYYSPLPVGVANAGPASRVDLSQDQYFVLGDNSPISLDSRTWGPLPARLLLGRPLFAR